MTDFPTPEDLDLILNNILIAEAASRAAVKEITDTRSRLKRMEVSLALVLTSLVEFQDDRSDYVLHRLSQELRRLAELPDTAAKVAGCDDDDIDPKLLQAIASHLAGMRSERAWRAATPSFAVMH